MDMIRIIKQAALEAVEASKPVKIMYGTVSAASPLAVKLDQKFTLASEFLVVPKHLTDYKIKMSVEGTGEREYTVKNALAVGDRVILLQEQGGQRYIVFDRVGD